MHELYERFLLHLDEEDRYGCVDLILAKLSANELDVVTAYDEILAPSLREGYCRGKHREICVWEEHVRTSIARTVIECCYPYVVKERDHKYKLASRGKAIVVCPTEELHEIGARMVADFFTLCGFDSMFVGANTPQAQILEAIGCVKPRYVAISVTSYYNLLAARRLVEKTRSAKEMSKADFTIVVGGYAFERNPEISEEMGADLLLSGFEGIRGLS
jgi:methanogenic corrinoid protein MtbC1